MAKVSLRVYNREIEAMIDRGQLDEAIAHCQHILKTFPKHLETYRLLGKAYLEYKRYNEAVDIFSRVLAAEPNDFVSNVGMSIIRDEQGKMDDSIWHMERAFETQPSNPAIQGELQRLYGRRDGVRPPRIRMTRGALAHMYVQGELYPQAISEIKSVLKEDPGRSDMSVLLARAYYRSGQKNQAADEAAAVLRRYPYCLEANRVMVEIAGADRSESAQAYRQRVVELDPYTAHVTGTIFQTSEVGDNAVVLEHLEWDGEPVAAMPSDWGATKTITPESAFGHGEPPAAGQAEPDWLKMGLGDSGVAHQTQPTVVPPLPESPSPFDLGAPGEPAQPTPEEEIPDFLRAAGWGKSTGAFDESKSALAGEPAISSAPTEPIEQGDLPDWVKAMAPEQTVEPAPPAEEEELPDWIKNMGTGALASAALKPTDDQMDWMKEPEEPAPSGSVSVPASSEEPGWRKDLAETAQPGTSDEQFDWLKDIEQPSDVPEPAASDETRMWLQGLEQREAAQPTPAEEQPNWMKGPDQQAETVQPAEVDDSLDWLKGIDQPAETTQASGSDETMAWLKGLDQPEVSQPTPMEEQPDWMKGLDQAAETAQASTSDDTMAWLKGLDQVESAQPTPTEERPDWLKSSAEPAVETSGTTDEFDWLEGVGAEPEPASEAPSREQPDWLTQFGSESIEPSTTETPAAEDEAISFAASDERPTKPRIPAVDVSSLGKSEQEQDDSFAWLEALAAKQGASEGLLTKPEERLEEEPDWVKQAKGMAQPPAAVTPEQPPVKMAEPGTSQQEIDDSLAWLESLAAKQGATEGLLTKPEERLQEEPDWVKQARAATPSTPPAEPAPVTDLEDLGKSEQERDDSFAWLEALAAKQGASEGLLTKPEERPGEEPDWVKQARAVPQEPAPTPSASTANVEDLGKSEQERDDSFAWLESLAGKQGATEGLLTSPEDGLEQEPEWVQEAKSAAQQPAEPEPVMEESVPAARDTEAWLRSLGQEGVESEPEADKDETAMWLKALDETTTEEPVRQPAASDDLPSWLGDLEEEKPEAEVTSKAETTAMWLKSLEEPAAAPAPETEVPAWLEGIEEEEKAPAAEAAIPEATGEFDWLNEIEEGSVTASQPVAEAEEDLPSWLRGVDEETHLPATGALRSLPGWMRDETGEVMAEPTKIEPTRSSDWRPAEEQQPAPTGPEPVVTEPTSLERQPEPMAEQPPVEEPPKPKAAPRKTRPLEPKPEAVPARSAGTMTPAAEPLLGSARSELSRSNIPGALQSYEKLIKKGRFLEEVIYDLRDALYRYPVEVSIWQSLGDAYMRANRLQDALDAYTKAEELLR